MFLAHYNEDESELRELATELRLHGILPWVDKQGGFALGDILESEARRAIREDCFGLLLYATDQAFDRPFIRDIELDEAIKMSEKNVPFLLIAVPRGIDFSRLQERSLRSFGADLSKFHTVPIADDSLVQEAYSKIASEVLRKVLHNSRFRHATSISLQYSTREIMPHDYEDLLCIDGTQIFMDGIDDIAKWTRLLNALRRIKGIISEIYGRPRLNVHGSKHLTGAFIFGRVFAPFDMDIRQTQMQVWKSDANVTCMNPLAVEVKECECGDDCLFLEVASGFKNVAAGVNAFLSDGGPRPSVRLQLRPPGDKLVVDNNLCQAMAEQTYSELERTLLNHHVREIHLFAAVPQSFMMMLGHKFKGMPPVNLYEWMGTNYVRSCITPPGVL